MKHVTLFLAILIFVLGSSAVLAEKGGKGKGDQAAGAVEKAKGKADQEANSAEEKVKETKTRTITVRDPKTGRTITKQVPIADEAEADAKAESEEMKGEGKGKAQKGGTLQERIQHEEQKHATRAERLEQLLEKAEADGDEKMVQRIEKLMAKEQARYEKKLGKMKARPDKAKADKAD
ncbi:MAG: hypothetical protein H8E62_02885 [Planctomycetes bacterium]|nr:hypothetical protein [Planctomycetota bacterium]